VAKRRGRWVAFFRVSFLVAVATCLACEGGGAQAPQPPGQTVASRLTTGRTAADEQARAAAYTERAARYRQLADQNRRAVADLTHAITRQAEIATETRAPVTVAPPAAAGAIDEATIAPAAVRAKRQAAADLADRMAAAAQRAADLHNRQAVLAARASSGGQVRR
jgi:hypothetical protein